MTDRVRRHLWISGRVQGVFFRDRCRQEALHRGVDGFARNLADGRVEAVLEGPPDAVA
ncbi:MAG TPA: acylphosphatase, partial [Acidimicrobiia bacterium]|nr:acylphosphatase [Acidimicrobiia bacterium]